MQTQRPKLPKYKLWSPRFPNGKQNTQVPPETLESCCFWPKIAQHMIPCNSSFLNLSQIKLRGIVCIIMSLTYGLREWNELRLVYRQKRKKSSCENYHEGKYFSVDFHSFHKPYTSTKWNGYLNCLCGQFVINPILRWWMQGPIILTYNLWHQASVHNLSL